MVFFRKLIAAIRNGHNQVHLMRVLKTVLESRTRERAQAIVQEHPELLTDGAETSLAMLAEIQHDEAAKRSVEALRNLLRRCREVGLPRAFSESTLTPLTPEQFLDPMGEAGPGASGGPPSPSPPEFANDLRDAEHAWRDFTRSKDRNALDTAAAKLALVVDGPTFPAANRQFQLEVLNDAGNVFWQRYSILVTALFPVTAGR